MLQLLATTRFVPFLYSSIAIVSQLYVNTLSVKIFCRLKIMPQSQFLDKAKFSNLHLRKSLKNVR